MLTGYVMILRYVFNRHVFRCNNNITVMSLFLKNSNLSIREGAFNITGWNGSAGTMASMYFNMLSKNYGIDLN